MAPAAGAAVHWALGPPELRPNVHSFVFFWYCVKVLASISQLTGAPSRNDASSQGPWIPGHGGLRRLNAEQVFGIQAICERIVKPHMGLSINNDGIGCRHFQTFFRVFLLLFLLLRRHRQSRRQAEEEGDLMRTLHFGFRIFWGARSYSPTTSGLHVPVSSSARYTSSLSHCQFRQEKKIPARTLSERWPGSFHLTKNFMPMSIN